MDLAVPGNQGDDTRHLAALDIAADDVAQAGEARL
jgi:hypothetical protein